MDSKIVGLAGYILSCLVHCGSMHPFAYQERLTAEQIAIAEENAAYVRGRRGDEETGWKDWKVQLQENETWYEPIDFAKQPRFKAIGKLFLVPPIRKSIVTATLTSKNNKWKSSRKIWKYEGTMSHCTAFYVAPDILASAAHCLIKNGLRRDSNHTLIFRQQYDGSKGAYAPGEAKDYERIVIEWIYLSAYERSWQLMDEVEEARAKDEKRKGLIEKARSEAREKGRKYDFDKTEKQVDEKLRKEADEQKKKEEAAMTEEDKILARAFTDLHGSGFDFAFLRTNKPSLNPKEYYTLASPFDFMKTTQLKKAAGKPAKKPGIRKDDIKSTNIPTTTNKYGDVKLPVVAAGYPWNYAEYYEPVKCKCELAKASSEIVKKDAGVQLVLQSVVTFLDQIQGNQLLCVGANGSMGSGGSGGPLLLDENVPAIKEEGNPDRKRAARWTAVGITALSTETDVEDMGVKPNPMDPKPYEDAYRKQQQFAKVTITPWFNEQTVFIYGLVRKASETGASMLDTIVAGMA